jgi:hypothetical protein
VEKGFTNWRMDDWLDVLVKIWSNVATVMGSCDQNVHSHFISDTLIIVLSHQNELEVHNSIT